MHTHRYRSDLKCWPGAADTDTYTDTDTTHTGRRTLGSELWTTNGKAWQRQALLKMCNRHWLTFASCGLRAEGWVLRTKDEGTVLDSGIVWPEPTFVGGAAAAVADIRCRKYAYKRSQHVRRTRVLLRTGCPFQDESLLYRGGAVSPTYHPAPRPPSILCLLCSARRRQRRSKELKQNITVGRSWCNGRNGDEEELGGAQKKFTIYLVKCN